MDDSIITTYYLLEEFLKAAGHRDDRQVRLTTAEVMCTALVAAAFFGGNIEKARTFLDEYGYIDKAISKGRFNRRLHAIELRLCLAGTLRSSGPSLQAVPSRSNLRGGLPARPRLRQIVRIKRLRIYPREEHEKKLFAPTLRASAAISTVCGFIWW